MLLAFVALLYVFSIPWYRASGEAPSLIWGLPDWVWVALGCYVTVALLNAVAWLVVEIPERDETDGGDAAR
jgi:hypothetical protein